MSDVRITKTANMNKLKRPIIVIGFPGTGLVGSVAASQIIDSLNMEFGGYISSSEFAPLAAIHDYMPMPAARIHFSKKHNLIVIVSEMTIPVSLSLELADQIYKFAKSIKAANIISLGGISLQNKKRGVYIVSSDRRVVRDITRKRIAKPIKEGATTGVTGILLAKGAIEKFPITTILAESSEEYLDPRAAKNVLGVLNKMTGKRIDTSRLEKEAREFSKDIEEAVLKSKIVKRKGPGANESGSMYG